MAHFSTIPLYVVCVEKVVLGKAFLFTLCVFHVNVILRMLRAN